MVSAAREKTQRNIQMTGQLAIRDAVRISSLAWTFAEWLILVTGIATQKYIKWRIILSRARLFFCLRMYARSFVIESAAVFHGK